MSNVISHDTAGMRKWSGSMENLADDYDSLVARLYALVDGFVGSPQFKGGLSADFADNVLSKKQAFLEYSETFKECSEYLKSRAGRIDSDEAELKSRIASSNPLN